MNTLWRALGVVTGGIPNFAFTLGEIEGSVSTSSLTFTLRGGTRNEDKSEVTIFELNLDKQDDATCELARNSMRKAKTLMLPGMLRCFDAVEHNKTIYIATEPCVQLRAALAAKATYWEDEDRYKEGFAYGLHTVGTALSALHKNGLLHGNVHWDSVFVLRSGAWRLFGLELVSAHNDEQGSLYRRHQALLLSYRRPPESASASGAGAAASPIHWVDAWGLGSLIFETYSPGCGPLTKVEDLRQVRGMPRQLQSGYSGLTAVNPKLRMSLEAFLADTEFISGSPYVQTVLALSELSLKDSTEKDALYRRIAQSVDLFPIKGCKLLILPSLNNAVQYGGSSAAALEALLKIGARLTPEEFATHVAPAVVALFTSPDHLVRCRLLSTAGEYAAMLPAALVSDRIWPAYATGFSSKSADLRELSVRALVHFAPRLNEKIMSDDVLRYIGTLQQDKEGPIRTNSTICLGLVAQWLPVALRAKALTNGFGRMMRDPFVPSRVAAVRSVATTLEHYGAASLAEQMLPAVSRLAVDPVGEVREAALACMRGIISKLEEAHAAMPAGDPNATTAASPAAAAATPSRAAEEPTPVSPAPTASVAGLTTSAPAPVAAAPVKSGSFGLFGYLGRGSTPVEETPAAATTVARPTAAVATTTSVPSLSSTARSSSGGGGGGGWDDDDDDGWGESPPRQASRVSAKPTSVVTAPPTSAVAAAPPRHSIEVPRSPTDISSQQATGARHTEPSTEVVEAPRPPATGMKLGDKKKKGLGGSKVD